MGGQKHSGFDIQGERIENLGEPANVGDALRKGTRLTVAELPALTDEKIWKGTGADPTEIDMPSGATKEFFAPFTNGTDPTTNDVGILINANADYAYLVFVIPHDFNTITEAVVVRRANATATHRLNYGTRYGASGEAYDTHSESLSDVDTAETIWLLYGQDISGILSNIAVGDYVKVIVSGDTINTPNDTILGVRFKYS